ncbi:Alpha-aminoadipate--LysW ligase LysX [Allorhodopirellula solitaria]|uniref:Alpha-aminoadipate--LysW ligase LysX n=2 Tax=Allorhodopirellula solitaria TaxID=2527987 RepID=A0A5C5XY76_9BACT|nr:Alpha-aminoadipate--LysW ligase LysX [Allorhodopirellula solitaria]
MLVLGGRPANRATTTPLGWHLNELRAAGTRSGVDVCFADYESIVARVDRAGASSNVMGEAPDTGHRCGWPLDQFDGILTRTMPPGSMEQILFRLAVLHDEYGCRAKSDNAASIVNPPAAIELAIDKYATLARVARMGIATPATGIAQSRAEAMELFHQFGGDVVVKPIFGGEGRGVMRIQDPELAWTTFSTLQQLGAVLYVQQFVAPGGRDLRLLVIGPHVHAIRRTCPDGFRTNVRAGGTAEAVELCDHWRDLACRVCSEFGLTLAAIDLLETTAGNDYRLVEVNAIPGWKSAQRTISVCLAEQIVSVLKDNIL